MPDGYWSELAKAYPGIAPPLMGMVAREHIPEMKAAADRLGTMVGRGIKAMVPPPNSDQLPYDRAAVLREKPWLMPFYAPIEAARGFTDARQIGADVGAPAGKGAAEFWKQYWAGRAKTAPKEK